MPVFERYIGRVASLIDAAAAIFLGIVTTVTFVAVVLRYVFNLPFPGSFDVSRLVLGVAIFWGIAAAAWRDEHIQVDLLWQVSSRGVRRAMDIFADLVFLGFAAGIAWMLFWQVDRVRISHQTTFELAIPIWPFHAIAWLGMAFCALVLFARILRHLTSYKAEEHHEEHTGI